MNEEKLIEFLYIAPVALIEFDKDGAVKMANPRVAQLFNRFAPGGYFANLFNFLDDVLPELKSEIVDYSEVRGQIMENKRYCIQAPSSAEGDEESLWFDATVIKQDEDFYIASLNNVTNQVRVETEKVVAQKTLSSVFDSVTDHVIFTMTSQGVVDSWNVTGETHLCSSSQALGKVLSQLLLIENAQNADFIQRAKDNRTVTEPVQFMNSKGVKCEGQICISSINDQRETLRGFSVVLSLGS